MNEEKFCDVKTAPQILRGIRDPDLDETPNLVTYVIGPVISIICIALLCTLLCCSLCKTKVTEEKPPPVDKNIQTDEREPEN